MHAFRYGEDLLTVGKALKICNGTLKAIFSESARRQIVSCQQNVEKIVGARRVVYGINTGFGPLCTKNHFK
jgi:histidine ammonia-lyase